MKNEVLKKISRTNLKLFLVNLIPTLFFSIPVVILVIAMIDDGFDGSMLLISLVFGFFSVLSFIRLYKAFILVVHPEKSDLLKKYGSAEKIEKILNEIDKTKEYEDNNLVISKNYISSKNNLEQLVKCSDVLGVHKLVHKTNYVIDYYQIVITDKYGQESLYSYGSKQEDLCNKLIMLLSVKCKNAEIGYNKDEWDHIKNNKIELPSDSIVENEEEEYEYKCPECSSVIEFGDKFCKNCACKLDWDEDSDDNSEEVSSGEREEYKAVFKSVEEKEEERKIEIEKSRKRSLVWKIIGIIILSIVSSDMILMMILGDSVGGTPAILLLLGCAIPIFALYYYLFIGKNK